MKINVKMEISLFSRVNVKKREKCDKTPRNASWRVRNGNRRKKRIFLEFKLLIIFRACTLNRLITPIIILNEDQLLSDLLIFISFSNLIGSWISRICRVLYSLFLFPVSLLFLTEAINFSHTGGVC